VIEVTVWFRRLPTERFWRVNHHERGHSRSAVPAGTPLQEKLWASSGWRPVHCWLDGSLYRDRNGRLLEFSIDSVYTGGGNGVK
jgi:hypothetical protein